MKKYQTILVIFVSAYMLNPLLSHAATPSVSLITPENNSSIDRTGTTNISWRLSNIDRPMIVFGEFKLRELDAQNSVVGSVHGAGFGVIANPGDLFGSSTVDWGLNDTIPGEYTLTVRLAECASEGCNWSPLGPSITKPTKPVKIQVTDPKMVTQPKIIILSPVKDAVFNTQSKQRISVSWEAENIPKKSTACVELLLLPLSYFDFSSCKTAKNGKTTITGPSIKSSKYSKYKGTYVARVTIYEPKKKGMTEIQAIAENDSEYFILK